MGWANVAVKVAWPPLLLPPVELAGALELCVDTPLEALADEEPAADEDPAEEDARMDDEPGAEEEPTTEEETVNDEDPARLELTVPELLMREELLVALLPAWLLAPEEPDEDDDDVLEESPEVEVHAEAQPMRTTHATRLGSIMMTAPGKWTRATVAARGDGTVDQPRRHVQRALTYINAPQRLVGQNQNWRCAWCGFPWL